LKPRYRDAARDAAISAGILPRMMEYFAASGDKPPLDQCLEEVIPAFAGMTALAELIPNVATTAGEGPID